MKLSATQKSYLLGIVQSPHGYGFHASHLNYGPVKRLLAKGAIQKSGSRGPVVFVKATEAGRAHVEKNP